MMTLSLAIRGAMIIVWFSCEEATRDSPMGFRAYRGLLDFLIPAPLLISGSGIYGKHDDPILSANAGDL
jgi:hypothetical protein